MKKQQLLSGLLACITLLSVGCGSSDGSGILPPSKNLDAYESKEAAHQVIWGELEEYEGEVVWGELTIDQQSLVHYPAVDRSKVYWIDSGDYFHAMTWCYGLEKDIEDTGDSDVKHASSSKAVLEGTTACSKCVGTDPLPRLRKLFFGTVKDRDEEAAAESNGEE